MSDMWLVECLRCERPKAPRGCVPVDDAETKNYCTRTCPGYEQWPQPSRAPDQLFVNDPTATKEPT